MRKILKALSLVMVLVMCFTMVFTTAVSAEGATPTLTINSAAVKEGETVTITVDAANFGAVAGAHFVVALPAELENVAVADSDYVAYDAEAATVSFVKEAAWTDGVCDGIADGTLVTITAKAAVGTYVVDFAETGKTVDFCDANYATIDVTKVAGEVVVETAEPEHTHVWEIDFDGEIVPATGTQTEQTTAGSIPVKCACGETDTQELGWFYFYTCGSYRVNYESEIQFQLNAREDHLSRQGAYEDAYIIVTKEYATEDPDQVVVTNVKDTDETTLSNGKLAHTVYLGVPAKELTDNINALTLVKYNGKWYNGLEVNETIASYAVQVLAQSGTKETEKKLIADMLTYGAKMQIFKSYNLEKLADAVLGDYASYVTTTTPSITDTSSNPYDTTKSEVIFNKFSLNMASKVGMQIFFREDFYKDGELNDLTVKCTFETSDGNVDTVYSKDGEFIYDYAPGYTANRYVFIHEELPAKYMRAKVTYEAFNGDASVSYKMTCSIEDLAGMLIAKGITAEETAVYNAMLNFSDSAAAHFGI